MNLIIRNTSGQPIYDQITAQIKALILSGELQAGDTLPSMRALAKALRISVITTKRAYEELEREGFIETVHGGQIHNDQAHPGALVPRRGHSHDLRLVRRARPRAHWGGL